MRPFLQRQESTHLCSVTTPIRCESPTSRKGFVNLGSNSYRGICSPKAFLPTFSLIDFRPITPSIFATTCGSGEGFRVPQSNATIQGFGGKEPFTNVVCCKLLQALVGNRVKTLKFKKSSEFPDLESSKWTYSQFCLAELNFVSSSHLAMGSPKSP